jgi:hypothetical protein
MMRRFLFGKKTKEDKKKRLSPSASTPEGLVQSHPMYQYALNEYAQTVAPCMSNDDGRSSVFSQQLQDNLEAGRASARGAASDPGVPDLQPPDQYRQRRDASSDSGVNVGVESVPSSHSQSQSQSFPMSGASSPQPEYVFYEPPLSSTSTYHHPQNTKKKPPPPSPPPQRRQNHNHHWPRSNEPVMPDATYEECYGDAYVGGPIRYVYPSGYQSMRPRGGPWKLSIAVCISFTWLSVFVIDHCSDKDQSNYNQNEIDDDTLVIETRWCGSRLLYLMWVISMLITGLATAYCSVIGYIKVRDFAVANSRSQPPGMVGKSDYYVQLGDASSSSSPRGGGGNPHHQSLRHGESDDSEDEKYQKTIYQADGTPQFWGGHIYRPTQAAVAITSR